MENKEFIEIALKLSKKALLSDEVPVGAIIVKDNVIVGKGYNCRDKNNNVLKHAELIAIENANKKIKNWRLNDCVIYTTLFPCIMCAGAIQQARIKKIYYFFDSTNLESKNIVYNILNNKKLNHFVEIEKVNLDMDNNHIKSFFQQKRK